jgi:hypothetical protein
MSFTDYYNSLKDNKNNISFWYPKVKDCGILTPNTYITEVPEEIVNACFMEGNQQECMDKVYNWVKDEVMPNIPQELRGLLFIKNGAYSNKFDFNTACARYSALDIARSVIEINYASLMFETGGNAELAIRERIIHYDSIVPTIYNGMPLQNEYRIFYDFDNKQPLYIVNYWDWGYCHDAISRNITDKLVYECYYGRIQEHFEEMKDTVTELVDKHMQDVTGLEGIWSIDIMEANGRFWLIDMALGNRSAYWDPVRAGIEF